MRGKIYDEVSEDLLHRCHFNVFESIESSKDTKIIPNDDLARRRLNLNKTKRDTSKEKTTKYDGRIKRMLTLDETEYEAECLTCNGKAKCREPVLAK